MHRQRASTISPPAESTSDAARTTNLVTRLARGLITGQRGQHGAGVVPSEAQINKAARLCSVLLTSHIGESLMAADEASVVQVIRTRLVKTPSSRGNGVDSALRFDDLHRRLRLLGCVKNRAPMFHLLQALAGSGTADKQRGPAMAQMPPRVFSEPMAGLSGIDRVGQAHAVGAVATGRSSLGGVSNGRSAEEERYAGAMTRRGEGQSVRRARGGTEVTERALLRGILYAFQGIDSQYIKYCEEESGYVLDPRLRLGLKQREMVTEMLEMGWLFTSVVRYNQTIDAGTAGLGPGRIQQAFVFSLKEDMTEYYRLIAVLGAQLNLDATKAGEGGGGGGGGVGGTEGLTLQRLFVWVLDPLKRLKLMATLVAAAAQLKGGALASCLHTHMDHGDPFVRGLVQRTMVRSCESLFFMVKHWMFEGELVDHHKEFFVQMNPLAIEDEMLWQERYYLDLCLLPKFIEQGIALKILTIGKAINFLRRLCGDSEWIMGPMAKAAAQATTLEYGNTASLRAVVDSCSALTNQRLVHLMLGPYRLKAHLRVLKKFLLHGQGDLMLTLIEVLGPELDKKATLIYRHNVTGIVEGVIKTSAIAQEEAEDVARIGVKILSGSESDTGWSIFSLTYDVGSPVSAVVTKQVILDYRRVFHLLWRIKRAEWSLASAWRLHTTATHVRLEGVLPELGGSLHRCSLIRGQMFFLTTNLSNYMMFEVLETSWGTLQERLDSAQTLDDLINAHKTYLSDIMCRALLNDDSRDVSAKLEEVLSIIIDFCRHQESLVIRAMAEVTTKRAEEEEKEQRTARGQWGSEGDSLGAGRTSGRDPFGMASIDDTARRYEARGYMHYEALTALVRLLEEKSGKTEILRFLTFRLDFNDYYKERRAAVVSPLPPLKDGAQGQVSSRRKNR
ncbi:unnamed protein product [Laminaria digitata]